MSNLHLMHRDEHNVLNKVLCIKIDGCNSRRRPKGRRAV